jgi:hypothetical protein
VIEEGGVFGVLLNWKVDLIKAITLLFKLIFIEGGCFVANKYLIILEELSVEY